VEAKWLRSQGSAESTAVAASKIGTIEATFRVFDIGTAATSCHGDSRI
jgi:hypothetical protein